MPWDHQYSLDLTVTFIHQPPANAFGSTSWNQKKDKPKIILNVKIMLKKKKSNIPSFSTYCCATGSISSGIQLTLTIRIHLIRERPNPEMAPYLPAAEVVRQKDRKNPIQLKRNATVKAEKKKTGSDMSNPRCVKPKKQECSLYLLLLKWLFPRIKDSPLTHHNPCPTSPKHPFCLLPP